MNIFVHTSNELHGISTVKDLKDVLTHNNYDILSAKLILSNGKIVSPEVFQTISYDNFNITTLLEGSSILVYPKDKVRKTKIDTNIIPTIGNNPINNQLIPNIPEKIYYVVVDSGYEHQDLNEPGIPATKEDYPGELIALNHQPIKLEYEPTVRFLFDVIQQNLQMKYHRQFTNNPIFKVSNINSVQINKIINSVRSMEYNEIWGNGHDIVQYPISNDITLVHLKLNEVEAG